LTLFPCEKQIANLLSTMFHSALRVFFSSNFKMIRDFGYINESEGNNYPPPPIPSILNNPAYLPSLG